MEALLANLVDQSAVLGTLALIAIAMGKYALPVMREFNKGQRELATEIRGQGDAIREQTGWIRYMVQRQNGSTVPEPERLET